MKESTSATRAASHGTASRVFAGAVFGVLVGAILIAAIQLGVANDYKEEDPRATWGMMIWGQHPFIRVVASVMATAAASFLAGLIGRSAGAATALAATIPSVLLWVLSAMTAWSGEIPFWGGRILSGSDNPTRGMTTLLACLSLPLAFIAGRAGGEVGQKHGAHFDSRRHSILGIRWYHFPWLTPALYLLAIFNAWAVFYFLSALLDAIAAGEGLGRFLPGLLSIGLIYSFVVTWNGLSKAYLTLGGFDSPPKPAMSVLKFGCGLPLLGVLIQSAVNLLYLGVEKVLTYLSG